MLGESAECEIGIALGLRSGRVVDSDMKTDSQFGTVSIPRKVARVVHVPTATQQKFPAALRPVDHLSEMSDKSA